MECTKFQGGGPRDAKFKFGWGGLCPRIFQLLGGGAKLPPNFQLLGGKILKIPTYLVLKGKFFSTPLKTRLVDVSQGYPEIFLKVQKIGFYCIFKADGTCNRFFDRFFVRFFKSGRKSGRKVQTCNRFFDRFLVRFFDRFCVSTVFSSAFLKRVDV